MSDKEEYGLEDICESLDSIEKQLKEIIRLEKLRLTWQFGQLQGKDAVKQI